MIGARAAEGWSEAWGGESPGAAGWPDPPGEWMPDGLRCGRCPGAEKGGCCRHGEWLALRDARWRWQIESALRSDGRRGRSRRWRFLALLADRYRRDGSEVTR
jgi:hypothetical protein